MIASVPDFRRVLNALGFAFNPRGVCDFLTFPDLVRLTSSVGTAIDPPRGRLVPPSTCLESEARPSLSNKRPVNVRLVDFSIRMAADINRRLRTVTDPGQTRLTICLRTSNNVSLIAFEVANGICRRCTLFRSRVNALAFDLTLSDNTTGPQTKNRPRDPERL